ncbi:TatD family hydrolase [Natroniella sulfidigena]|uniref:TatD family hydrolase n=1 Tax=Natroniella sulfidigena TaxID=723921 RepID=UPI00200B77E1|nr:TatD family hydrolase [Natroniella sulfidigena]MCK8817080.1 TatD family hydrolase [Natroniella sulfidigena]
MLTDTHAHLDFDRFEQDRQEVIARAKEEGISTIINVGADMQSSENSVELAKEYDFIYASVGVHPHEAKSVTKEDYQRLKELARHEKVIAIGEIGLDYHYDNSPREVQQQVFKEQLRVAKEVGLPVAIHSRDAKDDTLKILEEEASGLEGVMHCYAYDFNVARKVLRLGFHIAFGGVITFNNASKLRTVVDKVSLNKILLETDAPYLTPDPHRGQRNEPSYVKHVAEKIAEIKGVSLEEVAQQTTANARKLFNIY